MVSERLRSIRRGVEHEDVDDDDASDDDDEDDKTKGPLTVVRAKEGMELVAEVGKLKRQIDRLEGEKEDLEGQLEHAKDGTGIADLKRRLANVTKNKKIAEGHFTRVVKEKRELEEQMQAALAQAAIDCQAKIDAEKAEHARLLLAAKSDHGRLTGRIAELERETQTLKTQLDAGDKGDKAVQALRQSLTDKEAELTLEKKALEASKYMVNELEGHVNQYEEEEAKLKDQVKEQQAQIAALMSEASTTETQLTDQADRLEKCKNKLKACAHGIPETWKQSKGYSSFVGVLDNDTSTSAEVSNEATAFYEGIKKEYKTALVNKTAKVQTKLETALQDLERARQELQSEQDKFQDIDRLFVTLKAVQDEDKDTFVRKFDEFMKNGNGVPGWHKDDGSGPARATEILHPVLVNLVHVYQYMNHSRGDHPSRLAYSDVLAKDKTKMQQGLAYLLPEIIKDLSKASCPLNTVMVDGGNHASATVELGGPTSTYLLPSDQDQFSTSTVTKTATLMSSVLRNSTSSTDIESQLSRIDYQLSNLASLAIRLALECHNPYASTRAAKPFILDGNRQACVNPFFTPPLQRQGPRFLGQVDQPKNNRMLDMIANAFALGTILSQQATWGATKTYSLRNMFAENGTITTAYSGAYKFTKIYLMDNFSVPNCANLDQPIELRIVLPHKDDTSDITILEANQAVSDALESLLKVAYNAHNNILALGETTVDKAIGFVDTWNRIVGGEESLLHVKVSDAKTLMFTNLELTDKVHHMQFDADAKYYMPFQGEDTAGAPASKEDAYHFGDIKGTKGPQYDDGAAQRACQVATLQYTKDKKMDTGKHAFCAISFLHALGNYVMVKGGSIGQMATYNRFSWGCKHFIACKDQESTFEKLNRMCKSDMRTKEIREKLTSYMPGETMDLDDTVAYNELREDVVSDMVELTQMFAETPDEFYSTHRDYLPNDKGLPVYCVDHVLSLLVMSAHPGPVEPNATFSDRHFERATMAAVRGLQGRDAKGITSGFRDLAQETLEMLRPDGSFVGLVNMSVADTETLVRDYQKSEQDHANAVEAETIVEAPNGQPIFSPVKKPPRRRSQRILKRKTSNTTSASNFGGGGLLGSLRRATATSSSMSVVDLTLPHHQRCMKLADTLAPHLLSESDHMRYKMTKARLKRGLVRHVQEMQHRRNLHKTLVNYLTTGKEMRFVPGGTKAIRHADSRGTNFVTVENTPDYTILDDDVVNLGTSFVMGRLVSKSHNMIRVALDHSLALQ